jgi:deoxyribose-phosphate aldolase
MTDNGRRAVRLEHHLLSSTASLTDLGEAVSLCTEHRLDSLVVSPWLVKAARRELGRSPIALGTVVAFPHGGQLGAVKAFEASKALEHGATQIDFVLNGGALVSGEDELVREDLLAVIDMAHAALAAAGVILEVEPIGDPEARRACRLAERAGADYVVTSAGGATPQATVARVVLARDSLGPRIGVKAAGRFKSGQEIGEAIDAGADRVAAPFSARLLHELADALEPVVVGR